MNSSGGGGNSSGNRRTAAQKLTHLELMLGQIVNFCPIISRNAMVRSSTSISNIAGNTLALWIPTNGFTFFRLALHQI